MKRTILITAFSLIMILIVQSQVHAHGAGASHEEVKDGYVVDIGYDKEFPAALEIVRFDFLTYPEDNKRPEEEIFSDVWVRITQDKELFFSGGINKPAFGATGFTYAFPKEGTYQVLARFQDEGETVVETSFTIDVTSAPSNSANNYKTMVIGFFVGLLLGVATRLIRRKKVDPAV